MTWLELCANAFNLAAVILAVRNHPLNWWIGIVGCALYGWMFYEAKLYADVTLQAFFAATCLRGYWSWKHGGRNHDERPISRVSAKRLGVYSSAALVMTVLYGGALRAWTDASFPFVDSIVLTFSVLGQFLQVSRILETWLVWILVNVIAVPLYAAKSLHLTSFVYLLFLVSALFGWKKWSRIHRAQGRDSV